MVRNGERHDILFGSLSPRMSYTYLYALGVVNAECVIRNVINDVLPRSVSSSDAEGSMALAQVRMRFTKTDCRDRDRDRC